ncbi:MAG: IS1 family transposase [Pirellulales bacterium]|nr:IS1 family transposase [Pirellulales bacterium]
MVISTCDHSSYKKNGSTKSGDTRYRCTLCGKSWTAFTQAFSGMRVGMDMAVRIVSMLCEGVSVRGTSRLTGVDKNTVIGLACLVGQRCEEYMARTLVRLPADDVQCDEIWQFIYCKRYTAKKEKYVGGVGDSYCYTAIERNTKLLMAWHMGRRDERDTLRFCEKLDRATTGRFQLSTDGWKSYEYGVLCHLRNKVDFGMLVKTYSDQTREERRMYSPGP